MKIDTKHIHTGIGCALIALTGFVAIVLILKVQEEVAMLDEYTIHLEANLPESN